MLPPGGEVEARLTFRPGEARRYQDKITFVVGQCSKQVVKVLGQGVEMKVSREVYVNSITSLQHIALLKVCVCVPPL